MWVLSSKTKIKMMETKSTSCSHIETKTHEVKLPSVYTNVFERFSVVRLNFFIAKISCYGHHAFGLSHFVSVAGRQCSCWAVVAVALCSGCRFWEFVLAYSCMFVFYVNIACSLWCHSCPSRCVCLLHFHWRAQRSLCCNQPHHSK